MRRLKLKKRSSFLIFMGSLLLVYVWLWVKMGRASSFTSANGGDVDKVRAQGNPPYVLPESKRGSTIIVAFCNYHFRSVGLTWYQRMVALGYDNHLLVATDQPMVNFLASLEVPGKIRYQKWIHEPMPEDLKFLPRSKRDSLYLQLLMAVRWKYLVSTLERGIHMVLTDADNIFTRYLDVEQEFSQKDPSVDVYLAYATKFPRKAFAKQGFCVCSGMSWWRASTSGIRFARLMKDACGDMCDDQRELNNLLSEPAKLNIIWEWTSEARESFSTNVTTSDARFLGLPKLGISGRSVVTGHKARIWDRDFAFRGPLLPDECPAGHWVSMPILDATSRQSAWRKKVESFQQWDKHCPNNI
jgi:Nucleotide-diphospho-sugar transferase